MLIPWGSTLSLVLTRTSLSPVAKYLTSWFMKQLSWSWLSLPLIGSSSSDSVHFMLSKKVKKISEWFYAAETFALTCPFYHKHGTKGFSDTLKPLSHHQGHTARIRSFKFYTKILVDQVFLCRGRCSSTFRLGLMTDRQKWNVLLVFNSSLVKSFFYNSTE